MRHHGSSAEPGLRSDRLDDLPIAVLVLEHGSVSLVNDEWTELTGRTLDESLGRRWLEVLHEDDRAAAAEAVDRPYERDVEGFDWRLSSPSGGSDTWIHARIRHLGDVAPGRCVVTITEIDDRKINELRLLHLATHDPTTGLPNRKMFVTRLEEALAEATGGSLAAVLFIDLDRFKAVNDTLGHRIGDLLLVAVAGRIEGTLRPTDLVSRLGGDEFGVVCTGLSTPTEATALATRIVDVLRSPFVLDTHVVQVSASIGVAWGDHRRRGKVAELVEAADMAMYRAKAEGGEQWSAEQDPDALRERVDANLAAVRRVQASILRSQRDVAELLDDRTLDDERSAELAHAKLLIDRARSIVEALGRDDADDTRPSRPGGR